MELNNLSANWKKLQKSLQAEETSKPPKRKPSEGPVQSRLKRHKPDLGVKQTKSSKTTIKSNAMGPGASKITEDAPSAPSASLALWAEDNDISAKDLAAAYGTSLKSIALPDASYPDDAVNAGRSPPTVEAGKFIAIDCEMVGVGPTPATDSALARVSVVNYHGQQLYDSFVLPKETVTDYRTHVSGITPYLLRSARTLETVQMDIADLLDGRILIGHSIRNDLDALLMGHPKRDIRDTCRYPPFRKLAGGKTPGLKRLAKEILGVEIQGGEHSSIEDARATMLLFRKEKEGFEREYMKNWGLRRASNVDSEGVARKSRKQNPKKKVKK
ncbi:REX4, RNA exonuclease 4 [Varicellaria rhodocarpa]|nr:REX4, RNA exonuclease 4 [Varicellaria rhodocarpa]